MCSYETTSSTTSPALQTATACKVSINAKETDAKSKCINLLLYVTFSIYPLYMLCISYDYKDILLQDILFNLLNEITWKGKVN